jgi:hypothetical protein
MLFSLRRLHHDAVSNSYTNSWVANLEETGIADVYCASLAKDTSAASTIYCLYPGQREHSFFRVVPFWIFCGAQHVGQGRVHDVYPYFEVAAHGPSTVYVIVAPTLELAKSKLSDHK